MKSSFGASFNTDIPVLLTFDKIIHRKLCSELEDTCPRKLYGDCFWVNWQILEPSNNYIDVLELRRHVLTPGLEAPDR